MKAMFIQDSAFAHGSKIVQIFLKRDLPIFNPTNVWPSISLDLNPCDYWLRGDIEKVTNARPPQQCGFPEYVRRTFCTIKEESAIKKMKSLQLCVLCI